MTNHPYRRLQFHVPSRSTCMVCSSSCLCSKRHGIEKVPGDSVHCMLSNQCHTVTSSLLHSGITALVSSSKSCSPKQLTSASSQPPKLDLKTAIADSHEPPTQRHNFAQFSIQYQTPHAQIHLRTPRSRFPLHFTPFLLHPLIRGPHRSSLR